MPFTITPPSFSAIVDPNCTVNLSWLEIGTSDFDTFSQAASVKPGQYGMSVEPVAYYLNRLPDRSNVIKVNAAVSSSDSSIKVFYVEDEDIAKHNLPYWVRGCNSVGAPHPTVQTVIEGKGVKVSEDTVPCMSFSKLVKEYNVASINILKIDTEGHDVTILNSMLDCCSSYPNLYPNALMFESNALTDANDVQVMIQKLQKVGYVFLSGGENTVMVKL